MGISKIMKNHLFLYFMIKNQHWYVVIWRNLHFDYKTSYGYSLYYLVAAWKMHFWNKNSLPLHCLLIPFAAICFTFKCLTKIKSFCILYFLYLLWLFMYWKICYAYRKLFQFFRYHNMEKYLLSYHCCYLLNICNTFQK